MNDFKIVHQGRGLRGYYHQGFLGSGGDHLGKDTVHMEKKVGDFRKNPLLNPCFWGHPSNSAADSYQRLIARGLAEFHYHRVLTLTPEGVEVARGLMGN